jgi:branched-chain amino acid aminotransferase
MVAVLAMAEAHRAGADEAVVLDSTGRVVEGTTSNVFLVKNGELVTPPEEAGILMGITREKILELARRANVPVREASFFPREMLAADEVFISSSIREIFPVVTVDGAPVGNGKPGPVTQELLAALRALANATS